MMITPPAVTGTAWIDDYTITVTDEEWAECMRLQDEGDLTGSLNYYADATCRWEIRTFGRRLTSGERAGQSIIVLTR